MLTFSVHNKLFFIVYTTIINIIIIIEKYKKSIFYNCCELETYLQVSRYSLYHTI